MKDAPATAVVTPHEFVIGFQELHRFNIAAGDEGSFECKYIEPGLISYKDHRGGGLELLRRETIERAMNSAIGNPLTVNHVWITPENRAAEENGHIREWYFNPGDGWFYVRGAVTTPRAKQLIRVKKPSNGYAVTSWGPGGVYNGIRYDREITGIQFNHLAIVEQPRYTDSEFRLNSYDSVSNPNKSMKVFKILKKLVTRENGTDGKPVESTKVESTEVAGDTTIEVDGQSVRLNELGEVWMRQTAAAAVAKVSGEDEVEIDGKNVRVNELVDTYRRSNKRENAAPAPAASVAPVTTEENRRQNEQFFTLSKARDNANLTVVGSSSDSGSQEERLKRGRERY